MENTIPGEGAWDQDVVKDKIEKSLSYNS